MSLEKVNKTKKMSNWIAIKLFDEFISNLRKNFDFHFVLLKISNHFFSMF